MSSGEVKEHGEQPIFEAHNFRLLEMPQHQRICSKTWLSTGIRILASLKTDGIPLHCWDSNCSQTEHASTNALNTSTHPCSRPTTRPICMPKRA